MAKAKTTTLSVGNIVLDRLDRRSMKLTRCAFRLLVHDRRQFQRLITAVKRGHVSVADLTLVDD